MDTIGAVALILVFLSWLIFGAIFLLRKRPPKSKETKRVAAAKWGMALQGVGCALVGSFHRTNWWPFAPLHFGELALAVAAIVVAYASCFFCLRAVRTLGKQRTYAARVIEGHELITQGPYAVVRNPIYLGMFGLMIATGLAYTAWWALLAAVVIFLSGNRIRISSEEKLLRELLGYSSMSMPAMSFFPFHF